MLLSAQSHVFGSKEALAELCKLYWYPLYGHIRRYGFSAHDAQDLTQGFFVDLLEHKALARADQQKGKFRSFLLEVRLALKIASQVAAGLEAVY